MNEWLLLFILILSSATLTAVLLAALTRHAQLGYDDIEEEAAAWRAYTRAAAGWSSEGDRRTAALPTSGGLSRTQ